MLRVSTGLRYYEPEGWGKVLSLVEVPSNLYVATGYEDGSIRVWPLGPAGCHLAKACPSKCSFPSVAGRFLSAAQWGWRHAEV